MRSDGKLNHVLWLNTRWTHERFDLKLMASWVRGCWFLFFVCRTSWRSSPCHSSGSRLLSPARIRRSCTTTSSFSLSPRTLLARIRPRCTSSRCWSAAAQNTPCFFVFILKDILDFFSFIYHFIVSSSWICSADEEVRNTHFFVDLKCHGVGSRGGNYLLVSHRVNEL